jgi:diaminohydroxyphosphoribosylaminopyrimidine deaminase/5-amino-6-(5-phosphoribosylamino)uracil reductase
VAVEAGPYGEASIALNEVYCRYICAGRPFVTLKAAVTLDGKLAAAGGDSRWVSGPISLRYAHWLRHVNDAILVGVNTVIADDPQLTCRLPGDRPYRQPLRVILDSRLRTPPTARVVSGDLPGTTLIATTEQAPKAAIDRLAKPGVIVDIFPADAAGLVDLSALLIGLRRREVASVLVEGGGRTHGAFIKQRFADKLALAVAPKILGGAGAISWVGEELAARMGDARLLRDMRSRRLGDDLLVEGWFEEVGECLLV